MKSRENSIIRPRRSQGGLTVVEVLIGLTVIAVIFLISVPSVSSLFQGHYLDKTTDDLFVSLTTAQVEASGRHSTVRICPSSDYKTCRSDGDWNYGWVLFSDGNANGKPDAIEVLQTYEPPSSKVTVHASGALTNVASFTIAGLSPNNDSAVGMFTICRSSNEPGSRKVIINEDGLVEMKKYEGACNRNGG